MISAFDLFSVGIGPSSSHTVAPMRAARLFATALAGAALLNRVESVRIELYGSLSATGSGHGTDKAVLLGLLGEEPATVDVRTADERVRRLTEDRRIPLLGVRPADYELVLHARALPRHPNALTFTACDNAGLILHTQTYYSVGGGFLHGEQPVSAAGGRSVPHPFGSGEELLAQAGDHRISDVMLANETAWRPAEQVRSGLLAVWDVMRDCVRRGCETEGTLPGGLNVRRRAPALRRSLEHGVSGEDPLRVMDRVALHALAVNEENAAGGRVVTAPTNGAAGVLPAVLHYYCEGVPGADDEGIVRFLLTAAAIGSLIKENASLSGAEVGCQGEVGSACAMAAAGLAERLGGTAGQVENAAEIALEHHLGMTCDPVGGLVQIPCIERNAVAAVKAVTAARMAVKGNGQHIVSLDTAITTMRETGADMSADYKETSRAGLALHVIQC
ncbi:L-serine ammonia-lyase [Streptomyces bugieae]|uniref:L-serine dehydratase n=1 Tax=Streptomyces bugieae TaxID=3098223 RepID=A0ABU7NFW8_9ACTN|nr:L-serine ammonia-lyase [Streptomyces sp. DSM 41528]